MFQILFFFLSLSEGRLRFLPPYGRNEAIFKHHQISTQLQPLARLVLPTRFTVSLSPSAAYLRKEWLMKRVGKWELLVMLVMHATIGEPSPSGHAYFFVCKIIDLSTFHILRFSNYPKLSRGEVVSNTDYQSADSVSNSWQGSQRADHLAVHPFLRDDR